MAGHCYSEPFDSGYMPVGDGHEIYYEQSGNPRGVPVIHLHGGPGDGSRPANRRFYDPALYRLIQMDQRGAGISKPSASITNNTTPHLISDIERLREKLAVDAWLVTGGSWGSYLAMVYAVQNSQRCLGLVLRGIVLGCREQVDWWFNGRAVLFPEYHTAFKMFIPEAERHDLLQAYYTRLASPDPSIHRPAAASLRNFMVQMRWLVVPKESIPPLEMHHALSVARLWTHYCVNHFFLSEGYILDNVTQLQSLPSIIVQGRYDVVTPMRAANDLRCAWPEAEFVIVPNGGHSADDPAIEAALIAANQRIFSRINHQLVGHSERA